MIRQKIAAALISAIEFRQEHPVISVSLSLLVLAACAGGLYLIATSSFLKLTCFSGGCAK